MSLPPASTTPTPGLVRFTIAETDEQRDRGDDFKVEQRLRAHPPDLFQIAAAGNADDERRKNQRRNDRLDEVKKNVAQEIDVVAPLGTEIAEHSADHQPDQNLGGQ